MGSQTFVRAWEARPYRPTCDPRAPRRNSADPRGPTAERDSPFPCIGPRDASDICVNTEGTTSGSDRWLASAPTGPPVAGSPICALPFFDRMRGGEETHGRKSTPHRLFGPRLPLHGREDVYWAKALTTTTTASLETRPPSSGNGGGPHGRSRLHHTRQLFGLPWPPRAPNSSCTQLVLIVWSF